MGMLMTESFLCDNPIPWLEQDLSRYAGLLGL